MLLIPGSSADHPEKRWPLKNFIEIAKWAARGRFTPVVVGGKAEGDIGNSIMKLNRAPRGRRPHRPVPAGDPGRARHDRRRRLSGPMHLAAARTPGLRLFAQE
jgi:ADP-heptose:LPS heptosyltransferase